MAEPVYINRTTCCGRENKIPNPNPESIRQHRASTGPSARVLALASLIAIVTECDLDDDTSAVPVRGLDDQVGACSMRNERQTAHKPASIEPSKLYVISCEEP